MRSAGRHASSSSWKNTPPAPRVEKHATSSSRGKHATSPKHVEHMQKAPPTGTHATSPSRRKPRSHSFAWENRVNRVITKALIVVLLFRLARRFSQLTKSARNTEANTQLHSRANQKLL